MQERSRSPAPFPTPVRRDDEGGPEAGSLVPFAGVRCPNPKCRKKVAEELAGTLTFTCRHCGQRNTVTR